jgi:hypothetical protein
MHISQRGFEGLGVPDWVLGGKKMVPYFHAISRLLVDFY